MQTTQTNISQDARSINDLARSMIADGSFARNIRDAKEEADSFAAIYMQGISEKRIQIRSEREKIIYHGWSSF
jgi:hypothetical protein